MSLLCDPGLKYHFFSAFRATFSLFQQSWTDKLMLKSCKFIYFIRHISFVTKFRCKILMDNGHILYTVYYCVICLCVCAIYCNPERCHAQSVL